MSDRQEIKPGLLKVEEAAEYLGFGKATLNNARSSGLLAGVPGPKFIKIGNKTIRYPVKELDLWLEKNAKSRVSTND